MRERIARHRDRRGSGWTTIEEPLALAAVLREQGHDGIPVLVDCVTLWLSNVLHARRAVPHEIDALLSTLSRVPGPVVMVANEVGLGIVPDNALARNSAITPDASTARSPRSRPASSSSRPDCRSC